MASWLDTIMSHNPVAGYRIDELTLGTMPDHLGNADGTHYSSPGPTLGIASPIESDSASNAAAGRVGFVAAANIPNMDGNHTWIVWVYNDGGLIARSGICRNGSWSSTSSNILGLSASNSVGTRFHINSAGYTELLSYGGGSLPVGWYMLMRVRNSNVGQLHVNGVLRAQTTSLPLASFAPYNADPGEYRIAEVGSGVGGFNVGAGTDEAWFFDDSLTEEDGRIIYESALNILPMRMYSNVLPSAVWYSQPAATPIHFSSLRHNFDEPILERISFFNNTSKTIGGSVEGSELRPKPRREIEIAYITRSDEERSALRAKLWAHQNKIWFVPIRQDFEQLASPLSSGVSTIPVSTQYKDYEVDSYVGIRELAEDGRILKSEVLQTDAVNPNDVHSTTSTVNSYSAFSSYVYPVRRGIISRTIPIRGHTDSVEGLIAVFELLPQDEAIIPNRITPWTPTLTYKGYEAHDPAVWQSHNWVDGREYDVERALARTDFETGIFEIDSDTPGAEEAFEYRMLLKGRDKIAQFLGWFYARGGSLNYLWIPSMQKDFNIIASEAGSVTVSGTNYSENFALAEARRDVAFVNLNNTMTLRRIVSFTGSPNETLNLSDGTPSLVNLRSMSLLKFCQMESDSIELAWVTDDLVQVAWRFKELLSTPA